MRPVVLVSGDRREGRGFAEVPRVRPKRNEAYVLEAYLAAVRAVGGVPVVVPPMGSDDPDEVSVMVKTLLARADAVLLTGGDTDVHPSLYGEVVTGRLDRVEPARTGLELALARACLEGEIPLLGICGGMQVMAVAGGGTLIQDLPAPSSEEPHLLAHEQPGDPAGPSHPVDLDPVGWLGFEEPLRVNSTHHQAVRSPGVFSVVARAPDGVVEAIAHPRHRFAVGVQWHPELLGQLQPYRALISAS